MQRRHFSIIAPILAPLFGSTVGAATRLGMADFSEDFRRLLRYGRAVDIRRLTEEVGYQPRYSTVEAVKDWSAKQEGRRLTQPLRRVVAAA